jgi:hypothetical protein
LPEVGILVPLEQGFRKKTGHGGHLLVKTKGKLALLTEQYNFYYMMYVSKNSHPGPVNDLKSLILGPVLAKVKILVSCTVGH